MSTPQPDYHAISSMQGYTHLPKEWQRVVDELMDYGKQIAGDLFIANCRYTDLGDTLLATMHKLGITEESHGEDKKLVSQTIAEHVDGLKAQLTECRELLRASEHDNSSDIANIEWHRRRDKQIAIQSEEVGRV